jgi:hypothetical protein
MQRIGRAAEAAASQQAADESYLGEEKDLVAGIAAYVQRQAGSLIAMGPSMLKTES